MCKQGPTTSVGTNKLCFGTLDDIMFVKRFLLKSCNSLCHLTVRITNPYHLIFTSALLVSIATDISKKEVEINDDEFVVGTNLIVNCARNA